MYIMLQLSNTKTIAMSNVYCFCVTSDFTQRKEHCDDIIHLHKQLLKNIGQESVFLKTLRDKYDMDTLPEVTTNFVVTENV